MNQLDTTLPAAGDTDSNRSSVYDGLSVELACAPFGKRFLAYCVDLALVGLALYLLYFLCAFLFLGTLATFAAFKLQNSFSTNPVLTMILVGVLIFLLLSVVGGIYHGYFIYFEYKRGGMTPGKKIFGLKVVSLKGPQLTLGQCILRDMFRYIDGAPLVVPGLISILASNRKQRIGDFAASTLVVYSAAREKSGEYLYVSQADYQYLHAYYTPIAVPREICERYLGFAYPEFILRRSTAPADLHGAWEQAALNYLPGGTTQPQDQRTVLLFFAELCARTMNEDSRGGKK